MPGIPAKYLETFQRLCRATDHLHLLIESGEFHTYGYLKRRKLIRRVRRLYGKLVGPVSPAIIGSAIAAIGVLSLAGCFQPTGETPNDAIVPEFALRNARSMGLGWTDNEFSSYLGLSHVVLADIDADGDLDLFYSGEYFGDGYSLKIFHQAGNGDGTFEAFDPNAPGPDQINPYNLRGEYNGVLDWYLTPLTFVDIDGDQDSDLVGVGRYRTGTDPFTDTLLLVENDGTKYAPAFLDPVPFPYAAIANVPINVTAAQFVDLDGDSDLDLVMVAYDYTYFGAVFITPNTSGSMSSFTADANSTDVFSLATYDFDQEVIAGLAIMDLDNDGDKDILISGYSEFNQNENWIRYVENTTTSDGVSFATPVTDPFGLSLPLRDGGSSYSSPIASLAVGDVDGDGDLDVIAGTYSTASSYYGDYNYYYRDTEFFYFENTALP